MVENSNREMNVNGYAVLIGLVVVFVVIFALIAVTINSTNKVEELSTFIQKQEVSHLKTLAEKDVQLTRLVGKAENIELRGKLELQKYKGGVETLKAEYRGLKNEFNVYKQFHPVSEGVKDARP